MAEHPIADIDRYAVIGHPVAHSRSPQIHQQFAQLTGQRLVYGRIPATPAEFAARVREFVQTHGRGLNVTLPHKQSAAALCDALSERARQAGAVNTLKFVAGQVLGDNTDGAGLVRDLCVNLGLSLQGKTLLVLGAGGATRGILGPLLAEQPARLLIANRTEAKATTLAQQFGHLGQVQGSGYADLPQAPVDVILNATSASVNGAMPYLSAALVAPTTAAYDLYYAPEPTVFMRWAQQLGATQVSDGLGMLVEQAAESFYLWRGVRPPTQPVFEALQKPQ